MNIILLCYKLSPERGSEYAVAWNYIRNMSKFHKIHVLYGTDGTADGHEMRNWIKNNVETNMHYYHVTLAKDDLYASFTKWLYSKEKYIGFYLMYKVWHKEAYNTAKKIISKNRIDVIHYLNPIGFKEPGQCWKIKDIPYVWGPVQGVENWPIALFKAITMKGKIEALYRLFAHNAVLIGSASVRKAVKRADYIFGATPNTLHQFKRLYGKSLYYLPENGITKMNVYNPIKRLKGEPLQLLWAGKFEDRKCVHLIIKALGLLKGENWELTLCGSGHLMGGVKKQLHELGIEEQVCLKGRVQREDVQRCFQKAHLHLISSMSEATTTVLFEAMSWGVPTLTLDHCGMSGVVCEKCGIKIPINSYEQVIRDIALAIKDMINNSEKVEILSKGVLECSRDYLWEKRVEQFNNAYENVTHYRKRNL